MTDAIKDKVVSVLGIDLAKNSFQLHGVNTGGEVIIKKSLKRQQLKEYMANIQQCLVGMEACGGSHYWARLFESYGHNVKLMAPQFVKPYVKSNKNDSADAEAICEAVQRPNMRFVSTKTVEQQDIQSLHRMRSLGVSERTSLINQTRGLLLEYGITIPQGVSTLMTQIPLILEDGENGLSHRFREILNDVYEELRHLNERIDKFDKRITQISRENNDAKILQTIPGVGPMIATALISAIGNINNFRNGRGV
jgi:transposase